MCEISYSDPQQAPLSWDERQNYIMWEASGTSSDAANAGSITEEPYNEENGPIPNK